MNQTIQRHFFIAFVVMLIVCQHLVSTFQYGEVNLTGWRNHRRQKRFILFEDAGISKLVTGMVLPVDLQDKRPWRQLVMTFNIQYQFPVPPVPIFPWDRFDDDRAFKKFSNVQKLPTISTDEAQMFLYQFCVELLNRRRINGIQCLQRAICENAQLHHDDGLFAELIHRVLIPHKSLDSTYGDAFELGRMGGDCSTAFPDTKDCLLNEFFHIRDEVFT